MSYSRLGRLKCPIRVWDYGIHEETSSERLTFCIMVLWYYGIMVFKRPNLLLAFHLFLNEIIIKQIFIFLGSNVL